MLSRPQTPVALVAEDEAVIGLFLEQSLADLGFDVVVVASVADALAAIGSHPIALALVDYRLRRESAAPILAALQQQGVPFCVCSGSAGEDLATGQSGGDFLAKPFAPGAVEAAIQRLVARSELPIAV